MSWPRCAMSTPTPQASTSAWGQDWLQLSASAGAQSCPATSPGAPGIRPLSIPCCKCGAASWQQAQSLPGLSSWARAAACIWSALAQLLSRGLLATSMSKLESSGGVSRGASRQGSLFALIAAIFMTFTPLPCSDQPVRVPPAAAKGAGTGGRDAHAGHPLQRAHLQRANERVHQGQ